MLAVAAGFGSSRRCAEVTLSEYERRVLSDMERGFTIADTGRRRRRRRTVCMSALAVVAAVVAAALSLTGLYLLPAAAGAALAGVAGLGVGLLVARLWIDRRPVVTPSSHQTATQPRPDRADQ
jgi:hypothetical protein